MPAGKRQPPKKKRIDDATSLFLGLLDFADQKHDRLPTSGQMLEIYDEAQKIEAWARRYFPRLLKDQKTGADVPFAPIHHVLFAALLYFRFNLCVLPRGWAKSTICTVIYPAYRICEKLDRYIMIGSYVADNARKMLYTLRTELETNAAIKRDYGDLKTEVGKWTDEFFVTADDVVVEAIYQGMGGLRGSRYINVRPELVILDDIQTKEEARNPERVQELLDWIYDEVLKLYADGRVVVVGTILEDGDAICSLIEGAELLHDVDAALADAGMKTSERRFRLVMIEASDAEVSHTNWPGNPQYTVEKLREMRTENESSYDKEMRHLPRSRKSRDFHTFHYYDAAELAGAPLRLFNGVDLIPGESNLVERRGKDTDYYANVVLAKHLVTKELYVYNAFRDRDCSKAQMIAHTVELYARFVAIDPAMRVMIEANLFQIWFADTFLEAAHERGLYPPVDADVVKGDKIDRITANDTAVNTGKVKFLRNDPFQAILIAELKHIRNSRMHDDLADAWEKSMRAARRHHCGGGEGAAVEVIKPRAMGF